MESSVVCALCAEFGARQYRILIFRVSASLVIVEDRLSEAFSNAKVGQWYSVGNGGQFWPIEPPLKTVTLPGNAYFCCKVALPVVFSPARPMDDDGVDTFCSTYIGQNCGPVLFSIEEAGLDRNNCYEAFVSLTSFNAPPLEDTNPTSSSSPVRNGCRWALVKKSDICGLWNGDGVASPVTPLKVQLSPTTTGSFLLLSTPSTNSELMADIEANGGRTAQSKSVPPQSHTQTIGNSSVAAGGKAAASAPNSSKSVPNLVKPKAVDPAVNDESSKGFLESVRRNALVLCWKLTAEDAFLVVCSDEQPRLRERIQCRKGFFPTTHKVSVGKFYSIEFSRYSTPNSPHVRIFVLKESPSPLESRLVNGELQLRIFIWRAKDHYWSEFCEVNQMPKGSPDVCLAWCKLNEKLQNKLNILVFVQLIDDLLKNNAMPSTVNNGTSTHRPMDLLELDELHGPEQVFDSERRNGSPDSITAEILRSKQLKSMKVNAGQKPNATTTTDQPKNETKKLATVYMQIKRTFHPWIRGPFDKGLKAMIRAGVSIDFKANSNDIVLSGTDHARVDEYADKLRTLRDGPIRSAKERRCRVAAKLSNPIAEVRDDVLAETGAIIVLPMDCAQGKVSEMEISLLGSVAQITHAWDCLRDLFGTHDVGELLAEATGKDFGDEKILRCIAAQQKSQPSGAFGGGRKTERIAEPKREENKTDKENRAKANSRPPSPFSSSSQCPRRSVSPTSVSNGFHNSRASSRLGSTNSLAANHSKAHCPPDVANLRKYSASTLPLAQLRQKQIVYQDWQWRYLIGNGGEALAKMVREVQEAGGHQPNVLSYGYKEVGRLHFSGPVEAVEELYKKITAKISLLNKNGSMVKDSISMEKQFHCQVIGKGGEFLRRLKKKHGVKEINVPSEFSNSDQIHIEGPSLFSLRSCKDDLLKLLDDWRNDCYEEVPVQRRFVPMIRGKNSNKIVNLLDGLPRVEVDLPPHTNDDATEDSLIKIRGHKSEVIVFVERLNEFVDNLAKNHHEDFIQLPMDDPNHSSLEFAKFVCAKKKQIEHRLPKLKLDFQSDDDTAQNANRTVRLIGPLDQVEAAKETVLELIGSLRSIVVVNRAPSVLYINCDPKHHTEFLRNNGQLLKEIKEDHGRCLINLNKKMERFEISCDLKHSGNRSAAIESSKAHIEKIINMLESKVVHHVLIPIRHHRKLGPHLSSLREQFNVRIQMPSKSTDGQPIVVTGPDKASVEATEKALRALCPVTELIEMNAEHRSSLMGRGGAILQELIRKHSVQIVVPRGEASSSCNVSVSGAPEDVRSCLMEIREHILPITRTILVTPEIRGSLIGSGGHKVKELCDKFLVKIHFSNKSAYCCEITVTGRPTNVDECEQHILSKVAQFNKNRH
ncbi:hypothetical protein niasHT_025743 [Heterodera trifolii]|uniref:K Homology domain-containing protein n=1 Tax=Heterodera trifolii TaxID=157864 RepID=A0ABD2KD69_9BILA